MASITTLGNRFRAQVKIGDNRASRVFPTREQATRWASMKERGLRLKDAAAVGHLLSYIPRRVLDALREIKYTPADITEGAIPAGASCGIYFLVRGGEIVYVGKTLDVFLRLSKHRRAGRNFDAFNFLPCPQSQLDELERLYITAFLPLGNFRL